MMISPYKVSIQLSCSLTGLYAISMDAKVYSVLPYHRVERCSMLYTLVRREKHVRQVQGCAVEEGTTLYRFSLRPHLLA